MNLIFVNFINLIFVNLINLIFKTVYNKSLPILSISSSRLTIVYILEKLQIEFFSKLHLVFLCR